jgi:Asp-tRNA(Asn)/Glu-tRNA(Gln) amidotransferase A subunit family amidase
VSTGLVSRTQRSVRLIVVGFTLGSAGASGAQATQPPRGIEVREATITELQRAMADGRVSAVGLVDAYLARIAAYDHRGPELNTMIRLNPSARADARRLDDERRTGRVRGPLHGIPIILKDNFDTADMPTSGGSLALANHQTQGDAFVVRKLRDAGAIIIGKSNMHELAAGITTISSLGGQTRNPYDPRRCPGGSSGGTGAAIAASFAAVGWGSDTCGSIRIPSAFGSLAGLRPTQGLVSRSGIMPLSHTQDIPGPLARTVTDLAIALDISVGVDAADASTEVLNGRPIAKFTDSLRADALRGARIGILANYMTDADGDIIDTVRAAVRAMKAAGADTVRVDIAGFDSLLASTSVINFEHKYDMIDYLAKTPGESVKSIADILATGLESAALEARFKLADSLGTRDNEPYRRALARQAVLRARIVAVMDSLGLDALVYPTMRRRPVFAGDVQLGSTCALSAQTGLPALSLPAGFTGDGLPVGIELLGRAFGDVRLVSLGYAFEQLGPRRRPPFSTPALVNGRAPVAVAFSTTARAPQGSSSAAVARAAFTLDRVSGTLRYDVALRGIAAARVQAVTLRRRDAAGRARVVQRLVGPVSTSGGGTMVLTASDRDALDNGDLLLTLITVDRPAVEVRVVVPN